MSGVLAGKVAVITGGTRGLGEAIARAFAQEGAVVVIAGRDPTSTEARVAALTAEGLRVSGRACDVRDATQVSDLSAYAASRHGQIDLWVNNAGVSAPYGRTASVPSEEFERVVRTNVWGVYYGSMTALREFLPRGSGKLVNVLGRGARQPAPMQNAYGASKAWVRAFTLALAREYRDSGVGVFAFSPGMVRTDLLLRPHILEGEPSRFGGFYQAVLRMWSNPPDVPARRAVWIAGPATDGRTGLVIEALGPGPMVRGLLGEGLRRLARRPAPDFDVQPETIPARDPTAIR
jgi:NAD(P)-dependent dehydrogenase (short-subunit alcohol dehydrogenase family)